MKIAAIDIGSNAARLQISSILEVEGNIAFKKVEYIRFPLRLGLDVFNDGHISPEGEVRIHKMLHSFKLLMELHEVADYQICATSAMREASNAHEIITRIQGTLDMKINVIEGTKEAELINQVVVMALEKNKNYLHIDVGGGSTELNIYQNLHKTASKSFKIGSVRLLEGKDVSAEWKKMERWVEENTENLEGKLMAVGTGGNINKLMSMAAERTGDTTMTLSELERLQGFIGSYSLEDRINKLRLNADRADVILPASQIYQYAMQLSGAQEIVVPDLGLKDGIIKMVYERMAARRKNMSVNYQ
jgi:exopolyphosphatase / guanosine-5'-triphosphate,3'-diphosphate pyrophosphatase